MRLIKWKDCTQDNNISATGQRTAKHVYSSSDFFEHSDYYVYDASGNLMSVYRKFSDANEQVLSYSLTERPFYGSSRLGVDKTTIEFIGYTPPTNGLTNHVVGLKQYEGSNHLGNILTTFSDKKIPVDSDNDGVIDYSTANITSSTDYYPFGVTMKGRDFTSNVSRFGFNGKEKDEETETMDFGARLLDGDLGVWLACDPLAACYPNLSSYCYSANSPIYYVDEDGEKIKISKATRKDPVLYEAALKVIMSPEGYELLGKYATKRQAKKYWNVNQSGVHSKRVTVVFDQQSEEGGATESYYNGQELQDIQQNGLRKLVSRKMKLKVIVYASKKGLLGQENEISAVANYSHELFNHAAQDLAFYDYVVNSKMTKEEVSGELIKESSGEDDVNAGKLTQTYQHIEHFMKNKNSLFERFSSGYREKLDDSGKTFFDAEKEMDYDSSSRDYQLGK